ncbi:unnamed protein product [Lupinus luteus]|uniref:EF-hand domain-containing protein n=1 Tax=Lupinus luteus TaxID=3873 RepID=A0AAV1WNN7_LUPLU
MEATARSVYSGVVLHVVALSLNDELDSNGEHVIDYVEILEMVKMVCWGGSIKKERASYKAAFRGESLHLPQWHESTARSYTLGEGAWICYNNDYVRKIVPAFMTRTDWF